MTNPSAAQQHGIDLPGPGQEPAFLDRPLLDYFLEAVIAAVRPA